MADLRRIRVVVPPPTVTTVEVVPGHQPEEIRLMTDTEFNNFIEKLKFTIRVMTRRG